MTHHTTADPASATKAGGRIAGSLSRGLEKYALLYVFAALIILYALIVPGFFSVNVLQAILSSQATQLIITLAVVYALLGGEFDLSVGNVVGATGAAVVYMNTELGVSIWIAIVLALAASLLFGLFNAYITVRVGVDSIVVTLGSGTLLAGLVTGWAGNTPRGGVDTAFTDIVNAKLLGLPMHFYLTLLVGVLLYLLLEKTAYGRAYSFTGANREVARLSGLKVESLRTTSLVGSSLLAALGGVVLVGITGASVPTAAAGYLLPAFAGAFLGSTVIVAGRFNVIGSFIAVYFLVVGVTGLQLLGFTGWIKDVFNGLALVAAVALTRLLPRWRDRAARSRRGAP